MCIFHRIKSLDGFLWCTLDFLTYRIRSKHGCSGYTLYVKEKKYIILVGTSYFYCTVTSVSVDVPLIQTPKIFIHQAHIMGVWVSLLIQHLINDELQSTIICLWFCKVIFWFIYIYISVCICAGGLLWTVCPTHRTNIKFLHLWMNKTSKQSPSICWHGQATLTSRHSWLVEPHSALFLSLALSLFLSIFLSLSLYVWMIQWC